MLSEQGMVDPPWDSCFGCGMVDPPWDSCFGCGMVDLPWDSMYICSCNRPAVGFMPD